MTSPWRTGRAGGRMVALVVLVVLNLILVALNLEKHSLFPFDAGQESVVQALS